jgi:hypothetical protein
MALNDVQTNSSDGGPIGSAGFAATCVGSPADVVGTRIMTDRSATQRGLLPYVAHMVRDEGIASLYKGFVPNFARIGRCGRTAHVADVFTRSRVSDAIPSPSVASGCAGDGTWVLEVLLVSALHQYLGFADFLPAVIHMATDFPS